MRLTRAALKAQADRSAQDEPTQLGSSEASAERTDLHDIANDNSIQADPVDTKLTIDRTAVFCDDTEPFEPQRPGQKRKSKKARTTTVSEVQDQDRDIARPVSASDDNSIRTHDISNSQISSLSTDHALEPCLDPEILITQEPARTFVDEHSTASIINESKLAVEDRISSPSGAEVRARVSDNNNLCARTPTLRRTSSTSFEASFEAMDSLEDTIEQITADLPVMTVKDMHHPAESPLRMSPLSRSPQRYSKPSPRKDTFAEMHVKEQGDNAEYPRRQIEQLQAAKGSPNKENLPPISTPSKTPSKMQSQQRLLKTNQTPARQPLATKARTPLPASTCKPLSSPKRSVLAPTKVATARTTSTGSTASTIAKATARATSKTSAVQNKPPAATNKAKRVVSHKPSITSKPAGHSVSKSMSIAPIEKPEANTQNRRSTSVVLSTAKPGFKPAKSTKAPTASTFVLPSEGIAEKFKAQKEAREERMRAQNAKILLAEEKSAKIKAEREARAERIRQNQKLVTERNLAKHAKVMAKHA